MTVTGHGKSETVTLEGQLLGDITQGWRNPVVFGPKVQARTILMSALAFRDLHVVRFFLVHSRVKAEKAAF